MPEDVFLDDDFLRQLMNVGEVDVLVGIPSHNNAKTIAPAIEAVEAAFQRDFRRERVVIVNVDAGSRDGTPQLALAAASATRNGEPGLNSLRTLHRIVTHSKDAAPAVGPMRAILAAADLARAKTCAIVSPSAGATPEKVGSLLRPVHRDGFDFVAPLYARRRFDGLLGRNVLYPLYRAAFGCRIRELHSGEFGFSGALASACLAEDVWHDEALRSWPQGSILTAAVSAKMRCAQAFVGPREHSPVVSGPDVVAAIRDAVGAFFGLLESRPSAWIERSGSEPVSAFGPDCEMIAEPMRINRKRILEMFRSGVSDLRPVLQSLLSPETRAEIERLSAADDRDLRFPDEIWVRALYELAASYHRAVISRDHVVQAFVPLYRGRIYSFLLQHQDSSQEEMETASEALCLEFERLKPYLAAKWTAKG